MELLQGIETRMSVRAFKPDPVSRELLEKVLAAAGRSPSYMNTQPWEVAVATGKKKDELASILSEKHKTESPINPDIPFPKTWPQEIEQRYRDHGNRRLSVLGIERSDMAARKELNSRNFYFFNAPCVMFILLDEVYTTWSVFDTGLFVQSLALAAHAFGLGTCLQASVVGYSDVIRQVLDIPKTKKILLCISLGYPDMKARVNSYHSARISPNEFVHWYESH
jgi:nitroreductase